MIINMMMSDMKTQKIPDDTHKTYVQNEIAFILTTSFSLFDGNSSTRFECLATLENHTHCCLSKYFPD